MVYAMNGAHEHDGRTSFDVAALNGFLFADFLLFSSPIQLQAASASERQPGDSFKDCETCPEMVVVPSGSFIMGSPASEAGHYEGEDPQHEVTIAKPFAVSRFEVTFEEWDACVADGGCANKPDDNGWGRGKRPVINISWTEIGEQYLAWLTQRTGHTYRHLSEAEWEYASRARSPSAYSWGDTIGDGLANCSGCGPASSSSETMPVGSYAANAFGLNDMHGNVWEWVQDFYHLSEYDGAPVDGSAWIDDAEIPLRIARGGAWANQPRDIRSANRGAYGPDERGEYLGFRVARTLTP